MRDWFLLIGIVSALIVGAVWVVYQPPPCVQLEQRCQAAREALDLPTITQCSVLSLAAPEAQRTHALCQDILDTMGQR